MRKKYNLPWLTIKSQIPLTNNQIVLIIKKVDEVKKQGDYDPCYNIARKVSNELDFLNSCTEVRCTRKKYLIYIKRK